MILLDRGETDAAIDTFESIRARGLGELSAALAAPGVTAADRDWLRSLALVEEKISARQARIVGHAVAQEQGDLTAEDAASLQLLRTRRASSLEDSARRTKFSSSRYQLAGLPALQAASRAAKVPVLLYSRSVRLGSALERFSAVTTDSRVVSAMSKAPPFSRSPSAGSPVRAAYC